MLTEERRKTILEMLDKHEIIKSQDLITLLDTSESTIRRDLQELESEGLLQRVHGGAKKKDKLNYEQSMSEKSTKNIQKKQKVAKYAANLMKDNDIIFLDAGTSTFAMIPFLQQKNLLVVTNSVLHANCLAERQIQTIIIGGHIKLFTKASLGAFSIQQIQQFRFNKTFLGMNGVHPTYGFTTPDPEEAAIKETALRHAESAFVLVDESKFNKVSFTKVADLKKGCILTNHCPHDMLQKIQDETEIREVAK